MQSLLEQREVEAKVPEIQDQGTREARPQNIMDWPVPKGLDFLVPEKVVDQSSGKEISELRQKNKNLIRDKLAISEQLKRKTRENDELKKDLKQLQEEKEQLKQKATKNIGVDASSSTDQKETKEMEVQTDVKKDDFRDLYDKKGKYVRTELSDPSLTSVDDPEKSRHRA